MRTKYLNFLYSLKVKLIRENQERELRQQVFLPHYICYKARKTMPIASSFVRRYTDMM